MRISLLEAMTAAVFLLAPIAGEGAGASFAYQGRLLNEKGQLLANRNHSIEFRIYDQASGGDHLWTCTKNVLLSETGQFSVELSGNAVSGESLAAMFLKNAAKTLYIGLTVDNEGAEISPRQKLLSVPKAVWTDNCVAARGNIAVNNVCYGSSATVDNTVEANTLALENGFTCGNLVASSLTVTNGNLSVSGVVQGKGVIPIGGIIIWSGTTTTLPSGWAICNGKNGTPDLTDRFIVGFGSNYKNVGDKGGEATHTLTESEMPRHRHSYQFTGADINGEWKKSNFFFCQHNKYPDLTNSQYTDETGGGQPHENRPPYYALCYIMRIN